MISTNSYGWSESEAVCACHCDVCFCACSVDPHSPCNHMLPYALTTNNTGVYPEIVEKNYFTPGGDFRVDSAAPQTMLNSLMYKLCYYRYVCVCVCVCAYLYAFVAM